MVKKEKNYGMNFEARHENRSNSREGIKKETMMVKGEDGQMVECEIVSTRDHESVFDKNAPVLPVFLSVICAILNIVPGLGTWFSALMSLCCSKSNPDGSKMKTFSTTMLTGLLQLILSPFIVGIIWSLSFGVNLIKKSMDAKYENKDIQEI